MIKVKYAHKLMFLCLMLLLLIIWFSDLGFAETAKPARIFLHIDKKYEQAGEFYEGRAMVGANNKYGFVDLVGGEVIPLQYDEVKPFSNGLAAVKKNGLWGYIDKEGNEKVAFKYQSAETFSEGLAVISRNNKYGYIDIFDNIVIDLIYSKANSFSEGLAAVEYNGKYGYIDESGNIKINLQYDAANDFSEGKASVGKTMYHNNLLYGYINNQGKIIIDYKYTEANPFNSGRANVNLDRIINYVIDSKGRDIFQQNFIHLKDDYSEDVALVRDILNTQTSYGYIDIYKNVVIPFEYWYASSFRDGVAWVIDSKNYKTLIIDKNNKILVSQDNLTVYDISSGHNTFVNGLSLARLAREIVYVTNPLDTPSTWANSGLSLAREQGLLPVFLDYQYQKPITREDFSKLALHFISVKLDKSVDELMIEQDITITENLFIDTIDKDIEIAYLLGIINGKGNNRFDPSGAITRQEAAVILTRVAKLLGIQSEVMDISFEDSTLIASWAQSSVQFITSVSDTMSNGAIMSGVGNNKFSPTSTYTREQAIITLSRLLNARLDSANQ